MVIIRMLLVSSLCMATFLVADSSDAYRACQQRCASLSGMYKYRCVNTCMKSSRSNSYNNRYKRNNRDNRTRYNRSRDNRYGRQKKMGYDDCKKLCRGYSGLDSVKCIRKCMDGDLDMAKKSSQKKRIEEHIMKVCGKRCRLFSGDAKKQCLRRCVNEEAKKARGYMKNW